MSPEKSERIFCFRAFLREKSEKSSPLQELAAAGAVTKDTAWAQLEQYLSNDQRLPRALKGLTIRGYKGAIRGYKGL